MRIADFLPLTEAPISDFNLVGDWNTAASFDDPNDRKLLTNPKAVQKIKAKWDRTPFDFSMWFVNTQEAQGRVEIGVVSADWMAAQLPEAWAAMTIDPKAITVVFTNNTGAEAVPMTGWIIAHRFSHAITRPSLKGLGLGRRVAFQIPAIRDARDAFQAATNEIFHHAYGFQGLPRHSQDNAAVDRIDAAMVAFWQHVCTFRSARDGEIRTQAEIVHELFAQYLLNGAIRFNTLPESFAWGRGEQAHTDTDHDAVMDYADDILDGLAAALETLFEQALADCVGKIFVM